MLTLPMAAWLKEFYPDCKVLFLGRSYTKDIIESYEFVDEFYEWSEDMDVNASAELLRRTQADAIIHVFPRKVLAKAAKKAGIETRVGTSHRAYHLLSCNIRPNFTRKKSDLHEAQLNHALLRPFGLETLPSLVELNNVVGGFNPDQVDLPEELQDALNSATKKIILHPKSQGSAREWPIENYVELTKRLISEGVTVLYTGTDKEGELFRNELPRVDGLIDTTGQLSLKQLMELIRNADGLVACSTGPLHIAGFMEIKTVGLFSSRRPIHPGRWKALGKNVSILVNDPSCDKCASGVECPCIESIAVERVFNEIM